MNTKGVEDGISDDVCKWCGCMLPEGMYATCFQSPTRWCERAEAVPEAPTFSCQLAMCLTRNGADAPHMQAEINKFLYENGWKTMQGKK